MDVLVAADYHIFWYDGAMPALGIGHADRKGPAGGRKDADFTIRSGGIRNGSRHRDMTRRYEELCSAQPLFLRSELPAPVDEKILDDFVSSIGPGGIPEGLVTFGMEKVTPTPSEEVTALFLRSVDYAERYAHVEAGDYSRTPCIFDTGASSDLTPFRADFITYTPVEMEVKGVAGNGKVAGRGTILRRYTTRDGEQIDVPSMAYHMPGADVRSYEPSECYPFPSVGMDTHF